MAYHPESPWRSAVGGRSNPDRKVPKRLGLEPEAAVHIRTTTWTQDQFRQVFAGKLRKGLHAGRVSVSRVGVQHAESAAPVGPHQDQSI